MIDLSWAPEEHRAKVEALMPDLAASCERAEKSKRFIAIQLDPMAEWKGWPSEAAETWLQKRPGILFKYFAEEATAKGVSRALDLYLNNTYKPQSARGRGRPPREPVPGVEVPSALSDILDEAAWTAMWKFGGVIDGEAMRQALKIPKNRDEAGDDAHAVIASAGTVTGDANRARYMSVRGDLYWSDLRNNLDIWIRARVDLIAALVSWEENGRPRAWEEGGEWVDVQGGRIESNPALLIAASANKRAFQMASEWKREGNHASYEVLSDETDFDIINGPDGMPRAIGGAAKVKPERRQHKAKAGHQHYAWGLRDDANCYTPSTETYIDRHKAALVKKSRKKSTAPWANK